MNKSMRDNSLKKQKEFSLVIDGYIGDQHIHEICFETPMYQQTLTDVAEIKVVELFSDIFDEMIYEAKEEVQEQFAINPQGRFSLLEVADKLYPHVRDYLKRMNKNEDIVIYEQKETEKIEIVRYSLFDIIDKVVEEQEISECSNCDIGSIIESSLMEFEKRGQWHCALMSESRLLEDACSWPKVVKLNDEYVWADNANVYEPVIWFGLKDNPTKPWILSKNTESNDLTFWLSDDIDEQMTCLLEEDYVDGFLIWYFCEMGSDFPDIDLIRQRCPISIEESDDKNSISQKIEDLFLSMQTCANTNV